jgi:CheY-specific phosphatase CheX
MLMNEALKQAALGAALRVFETSTFMNVMPSEIEILPESTEPLVTATVAFRGATTGSISLCIVRSLLGPLAANMLGEMEDDALEEKGGDALKEITNMICGNFLTMWMGEQEIFELSPPEIQPDEENAVPDKSGSSVYFFIEDTIGQIIVAVTSQPAGSVEPGETNDFVS